MSTFRSLLEALAKKDNDKAIKIFKEFLTHDFSEKTGLSLEDESESSDDDDFDGDLSALTDEEISDSDLDIIKSLFELSLEAENNNFVEALQHECGLECDHFEVEDVIAFEQLIITHIRCEKTLVLIETHAESFKELTAEDFDDSFGEWVLNNSTVYCHSDEEDVE